MADKFIPVVEASKAEIAPNNPEVIWVVALSNTYLSDNRYVKKGTRFRYILGPGEVLPKVLEVVSPERLRDVPEANRSDLPARTMRRPPGHQPPHIAEQLRTAEAAARTEIAKQEIVDRTRATKK